MRVVRSCGKAALHLSAPVVATLGNFDGVHRGHQTLLAKVERESACGQAPGTAVVVSFYPHPAKVLGKVEYVPTLTDLRQRRGLFASAGIDVLYLVHFTRRIALMSAHDFVVQELIARLNVQHLIIGPDARVGKGREGTPAYIESVMKSYGRSVDVVPEYLHDGERISSGLIREAVRAGNIERARLFLGRHYAIAGRVLRGAGRGSVIGVPTANVNFGTYVLPSFGVYAGMAQLAGKSLEAVVNVGVRPTINTNILKPSVEVHLIDFPHRPLYGERIEISFMARVRDELRFKDLSALSRQISKDIEAARRMLGKACL